MRELIESQASSSSSTAVEGGMDVTDGRAGGGRMSEFSKTMVAVDRQCDEIGAAVDGTAIMETNDVAERRRYELARENRGGRWRENGGFSWLSESKTSGPSQLREEVTTSQQPPSYNEPPPERPTENPAPFTADPERAAADALHRQDPLPAPRCRNCQEAATMTRSSLSIVALSLLLTTATPFIFGGLLRDEAAVLIVQIKEAKHVTRGWVILAVDWAAYWSVVSALLVVFVGCDWTFYHEGPQCEGLLECLEFLDAVGDGGLILGYFGFWSLFTRIGCEGREGECFS